MRFWIEVAAVILHMGLCVAHTVCGLFHVAEKNRGHAGLHFAIATYDGLSFARHWRRIFA